MSFSNPDFPPRTLPCEKDRSLLPGRAHALRASATGSAAGWASLRLLETSLGVPQPSKTRWVILKPESWKFMMASEILMSSGVMMDSMLKVPVRRSAKEIKASVRRAEVIFFVQHLYVSTAYRA